MHTDEYGISLSRELNVCRRKILKLEKDLSVLERKYNLKTELFVEEFNKGGMEPGRDFTSWIEGYRALCQWRERAAQYEEMYRLMKT